MNNERKIKVGNRYIGDNEPVFVIAEIGINHNGLVEVAKKMIEAYFPERKFAQYYGLSDVNFPKNYLKQFFFAFRKFGKEN